MLKHLLSVALVALPGAFADLLQVRNQLPLAVPHPSEPVSSSDPAGSPNLAYRIEITAHGSAGLCDGEEKSTTGYVRFTNSEGKEDKNMFFWLFHARGNASDDAPVVLVHGGGPGAGPCVTAQSKDDPDAGMLVPAPNSWTDSMNLLAVDYPVGVGFSYGEQSSLRNDSMRAAWDLDDFLQAFWGEFPDLAKNNFSIHSASYGGTYVPNTVNVIHSRNLAAEKWGDSTRLIKMPETVVIGNDWASATTHYRYSHTTLCADVQFFNESQCALDAYNIPACLDALQFAAENPSLATRRLAHAACPEMLEQWENKIWPVDMYDMKKPCEGGACYPEFDWLNQILGDKNGTLSKFINTPCFVDFTYLAVERVTIPFQRNGDMMHDSYKLLTPAMESGLRVLIYNGLDDAICPWKATLAWMNLLKSPHTEEFRSAAEVPLPGIGSVQQAGRGAGAFTFLKIENAGHMVIRKQSKTLRSAVWKFIKNEPWTL